MYCQFIPSINNGFHCNDIKANSFPSFLLADSLKHIMNSDHIWRIIGHLFLWFANLNTLGNRCVDVTQFMCIFLCLDLHRAKFWNNWCMSWNSWKHSYTYTNVAVFMDDCSHRQQSWTAWCFKKKNLSHGFKILLLIVLLCMSNSAHSTCTVQQPPYGCPLCLSQMTCRSLTSCLLVLWDALHSALTTQKESDDGSSWYLT